MVQITWHIRGGNPWTSTDCRRTFPLTTREKAYMSWNWTNRDRIGLRLHWAFLACLPTEPRWTSYFPIIAWLWIPSMDGNMLQLPRVYITKCQKCYRVKVLPGLLLYWGTKENQWNPIRDTEPIGFTKRLNHIGNSKEWFWVISLPGRRFGAEDLAGSLVHTTSSLSPLSLWNYWAEMVFDGSLGVGKGGLWAFTEWFAVGRSSIPRPFIPQITYSSD